MDKFENKLVYIPGQDEQDLAILDALGNMGWELVSILSVDSSSPSKVKQLKAYLKRKRE